MVFVNKIQYFSDNHFFFVDFDDSSPILIGAILIRIFSIIFENISKVELHCFVDTRDSSPLMHFFVKISSCKFSSIPIRN